MMIFQLYKVASTCGIGCVGMIAHLMGSVLFIPQTAPFLLRFPSFQCCPGYTGKPQQETVNITQAKAAQDWNNKK